MKGQKRGLGREKHSNSSKCAKEKEELEDVIERGGGGGDAGAQKDRKEKDSQTNSAA